MVLCQSRSVGWAQTQQHGFMSLPFCQTALGESTGHILITSGEGLIGPGLGTVWELIKAP